MTRKKKKKCRGEGREIYQHDFLIFSLVMFNWESIILQELANKKQVINDEMYQTVDFK